MSTYTPNLNLYKIIPSEDANKAFDFYSILNDNWDKLDDFLKQFNDFYNKVYGIGVPIFRLDNTLYTNEVRLEGGEVLRTDYPDLYAKYGTKYGNPSSSRYFVLPDFTNRILVGATSFGYTEYTLNNTGSGVLGAIKARVVTRAK